MTAPLSIVIPTRTEADRIGPCLGAIAEAILEGLIHEVILVDCGSSDAIARIAEETGARLIHAPEGRGSQLAAGARAASGEWLFFVHADTVLPQGWADLVARHLAGGPEQAAYFRLAFRSTHPMARPVAAWANLRSRLFGLPYGDQGLLLSRQLYDQIGGYSEIPIMEDVAIARRLCGKLAMLEGTVTTSPERYDRDGWLRRSMKNFATLVLYLCGRAPERLLARYEGR